MPEPPDLRSEHGVLQLDLSIEDTREPDGSVRYCYHSRDGAQSPTLRVKPGDWVILRLTNRLADFAVSNASGRSAGSGSDPTTSTAAMPTMPSAAHADRSSQAGSSIHFHSHGHAEPCRSGSMSPVSTNLHFHGLSIPPLCHQDEVLETSIAPGSAPFEYRFRIPLNEAPGLYWYHPHIHGFSAQQVSGGASGALIVEGLEQLIPEVAGLPERVLVIRDQDLLHPDAVPAAVDIKTTPFVDHDGDATNTGTGFGRPAKDLSVNYVPVPYPDYAAPTISMKPGERQLWRVLNASSVTYLNISMVWTRGQRRREQFMGLVAVDGVPLDAAGSPEPSFQWRDRILVPPGGRAELLINGPPVGTTGQLVTRFVDTGPAGENDPNRPLVSIVTDPNAPAPPVALPREVRPPAAPKTPWIGSVTPQRTRKLILSEEPVDPADPRSATRFYITVEGQPRKLFDPASAVPAITVHQGEVEDWIIENRSSELHAFHIHQIHFEIVEWLGVPVNEPFLRDTINVPYWTPHMSSYPSIRLRMDFRDPNTVGTFPFHCHLLDHEDGGMMGLIRVEPPAAPAVISR